MRVLIGLVVAGLIAGSFTSARAEEYCGFLDKAHSQVRCGFTSVKDCKQALHHKKDSVCMPSPSFAKSGRVSARKG
jgi:hypothetical protein